MPYKYIGRTTDFKGKSIWELVGNLKNYGVGRVLIRQMFQRYPEPCYMKILKVEPLECPPVQNMDVSVNYYYHCIFIVCDTFQILRKVRIHVQETFRGRTLPEPVIMEHVTYKTDFQLIPKDEEANICKPLKLDPNIAVFPRYYKEWPPMLRELLMREQKANGGDPQNIPKLEIAYNPTNYGKYRIAEEGETPTVEFDTLPDYNSPLYANLKFKT